MNFFKKLSIPVLTAILISVVYSRAIDNPTFFDSEGLIFPGGLKLLDFIGWIWDLATSLFFDIDRRISMQSLVTALDLNGQNLFSIALHGFNSALLFFLLRSFFRFKTAAITSIFFAINPAAIYAVCYLINRSQLFMVFFGLLQCLFFVKALISNKWISPFLFILSLVCFKLAMLSKEHGVVLFAAFPILAIAIRESKMRSIVYVLIVVSFGAFIGTEVIEKTKNIGGEYYAGLIERSCEAMRDRSSLHLRSALTQAGLFFRYFLNWVIPLPTSIDMRFPFVQSVWNLSGAIAFAGFVVMSVILLIRESTRYLGCGLLLAVCLFLPEFSSIRAGEIFVMYRSYLYSIGYMIAIAWVVERLNPHRLIAVVLLLVLAGITSNRLKDFDSELSLWAHAASMIDLSNPEIACQGARAFNNAGGQFMKAGRYLEAINYFKTASMIDPEWNLPFSNLGIAYLFTSQIQKAEIVFSDLSGRSGVPEDMAEQARAFLGQIRGL